MSRVVTLMLSLTLVLSALVGPRESVRHDQIAMLSVAVNRVAVIGDSYTTGTEEGGLGSKNWTTLAWQMLAQQGAPVSADVEAEGGAGYGTRGNRGGVFEDLTARAVKPDDVLVVFYGSRNDQAADPALLSVMVYGTLQLARRTAPSARLLVIGPPWPTADPPADVLRIRDLLG